MGKINNRHRMILFVLLLLGSLAGGCRFGRRAEPTPIPITLPTRFASASSDSASATYRVQNGTVFKKESYSGQITLTTKEELYFRRNGRVTQVFVQDGDMVEAGDIIAEMDNESLQTDLVLAQESLEVAKLALADAQQKLEDSRQLAQWNLDILNLRLRQAESEAQKVAAIEATASITAVVQATSAKNTISSTEPIELAILRIQQQQAQLTLNRIPTEVDPSLPLNVRRAEVSVERVKQSILEGQVVASYSGQIRFIKLTNDGEPTVATAYTSVARLVDPKEFRVELNLTRTQMEPLHEKMAVTINAANFANGPISGIISSLPQPFGTSSGTVTEVMLANAIAVRGLSEGKTVAVDIVLQSAADALVIPSDALRQREQLYFVLLQEGDTQREVNVTVGLIGEPLAEIIAGLQIGDRLIVDSENVVATAVAQITQNAETVRVTRLASSPTPTPAK